MRLFRFVLLVSLLGSVLLACGASEPTAQRVLSVGVALGRGGLGDRSFNDSAYAGLLEAQRTLDIRFQTAELKEGDTPTSVLQPLLSQNHDLIIVLGQEYAAELATLAAANPEQRFAIIDAPLDAPNVTAITFRELEGDFLAGALTGLLSTSGTVGFLGGAETELIQRIEYGWEQGVLYARPDATVLIRYTSPGDDFSGFANPDRGRSLSIELYEEGADVVYAAAGRTSLGAIEGARAQQRLIITTGADQRWINEAVVSTRTKNMDTAVLKLLGDLRAETLAPGLQILDLKSDGVGLTELDHPAITEEMRTTLAEIRAKLDSGEITVKETR